MVASGSGSGCIPTSTAVCRPATTLKWAPSILKSGAVTEMRYLPGLRPLSRVALARSFWSPWATILECPDVGRTDGHGQLSAYGSVGSPAAGLAGLVLPPGARDGRQRSRRGAAAVPGSPVLSSLIIHWYAVTASPLWMPSAGPTVRALATVREMHPLPTAVVVGQAPPVGVAGAIGAAGAAAAGAVAGVAVALVAAAALATGPPTWAIPAMASALRLAMTETERLRSFDTSTATPT